MRGRSRRGFWLRRGSVNCREQWLGGVNVRKGVGDVPEGIVLGQSTKFSQQAVRVDMI